MNDRIQEIKEYVALCERSGFRYHEAVKDLSYLLSEVERLQKENKVMKEALEKSERFISAMMEFYGEGLMVYNWHQNGDGEPWDNFFDNNMEGDELESIRTALSHLKG